VSLLDTRWVFSLRSTFRLTTAPPVNVGCAARSS